MLQVVWTGLHFEKIRKYWYDECHHCMYIMTSSEWAQPFVPTEVPSKEAYGLYQLDLKATVDMILHPLQTYDMHMTFLAIRKSIDMRYLAIQRSDIEIEILDLNTHRCYMISCKAKAGNRILKDGMIWSDHGVGKSQDFYVITKAGIEQYKVSSKCETCLFIKSVSYDVCQFWYNPRFRLLLLHTGVQKVIFRPIILQGNITKLPKRNLENHQIEQQRIHLGIDLVILYGKLYAVQLMLGISALYLYPITVRGMENPRYLELHLPDCGEFDFAVVDNVLICHSRELQVSVLYDIAQQADRLQPLSHPLPIRKLYERHEGARSSQGQHENERVPILERRGTMSDVQSPPPSPKQRSISLRNVQSLQLSVTFLSPHYVVQSVKKTQGGTKLYTLYLDLHEVQRSASRHPYLVPFLLQRGDQSSAKRVLLHHLLDLLKNDPHPLSSLSAAFHQMHKNIPSKNVPKIVGNSSERTNSVKVDEDVSSCLCITQGDVYHFVWQAAVEDVSIGRSLIATCLLEYIHSLLRHQKKIIGSLWMILAQINLGSQRYFQLHQLLQLHFIDDSYPLAKLLLHEAAGYTPFQQTALDMLHRLERYDVIVDHLLQSTQIECAMEITLSQKNIVLPSLDRAAHFFRVQVKKVSCEEEAVLMFHLLYSFYIEWGAAEYLLKNSNGDGSQLAVQLKGDFPDRIFTKFKCLNVSEKNIRTTFGFPISLTLYNKNIN